MRAVEEDAAAGNRAELEELLGMLHWVLEQLLQLPLHVLKTADTTTISRIAECVELPIAYRKFSIVTERLNRSTLV